MQKIKLDLIHARINKGTKKEDFYRLPVIKKNFKKFLII